MRRARFTYSTVARCDWCGRRRSSGPDARAGRRRWPRRPEPPTCPGPSPCAAPSSLPDRAPRAAPLACANPLFRCSRTAALFLQCTELAHGLLAADILPACAERARDERIAFHGREHQNFGDRAHAFHRPPRVLVLWKRLGEADELRPQVLEVRQKRGLDGGSRLFRDVLRTCRSGTVPEVGPRGPAPLVRVGSVRSYSSDGLLGSASVDWE